MLEDFFDSRNGSVSSIKKYHAKKRFSQNFLNDKRVAKKIVDCADIDEAVVIEIGAGKGILTKIISTRAASVYAVELDRELIPILENLSLPNVEIINDDFLQLDIRKYRKPVIIGNIPYSITTQILEKIAGERKSFERAILTIQKEYCARLFARPGSVHYGPMSLFIKYYFNVEKRFSIGSRYFTPPPKISSVVVELKHHKTPFFVQDEGSFFKMIKGVFCYRRKYMKNALMNYLGKLPDGIDHALLTKRPAELELVDYFSIYKILNN